MPLFEVNVWGDNNNKYTPLEDMPLELREISDYVIGLLDSSLGM